MTEDLMNHIMAIIQDLPGSRVLHKEEAQALITATANKYGWDLKAISPWESTGGLAYPYNDPSEWGLLLSSMLGVFTGDVYLVVTNETHFPWPVIALPAEHVPSLLLELPHFEFFVFDDAGERMVFDTHHNELILLEK